MQNAAASKQRASSLSTFQHTSKQASSSSETHEPSTTSECEPSEQLVLHSYTSPLCVNEAESLLKRSESLGFTNPYKKQNGFWRTIWEGLFLLIFCQETLIFCGQFYVMLKANSLAVFTDMVYGGFDVLAAGGTLLIEYLKLRGGDKQRYVRFDDVGSCVSLAVLLGSTLALLYTAFHALFNNKLQDMSGLDMHVPNGNLVLIMVGACIVNDVFLLWLSYRMDVYRSASGSSNLNATAGILHVVADLFRCICVLADGVILKILEIQGSPNRQEFKVDIYCTIALCFVIIVSTMPLAYSIGKRVARYSIVRKMFCLPEEEIRTNDFLIVTSDGYGSARSTKTM